MAEVSAGATMGTNCPKGELMQCCALDGKYFEHKKTTTMTAGKTSKVEGTGREWNCMANTTPRWGTWNHRQLRHETGYHVIEGSKGSSLRRSKYGLIVLSSLPFKREKKKTLHRYQFFIFISSPKCVASFITSIPNVCDGRVRMLRRSGSQASKVSTTPLTLKNAIIFTLQFDTPGTSTTLVSSLEAAPRAALDAYNTALMIGGGNSTSAGQDPSAMKPLAKDIDRPRRSGSSPSRNLRPVSMQKTGGK